MRFLLDAIGLVQAEYAAKVLLVDELLKARGVSAEVRDERSGTHVVSEAVQDVDSLERDHKVKHLVILALSGRSSILN
jgi:hypothetical protein